MLFMCLTHAVGASQVALCSDRNADIIYRPVKGIDKGILTAIAHAYVEGGNVYPPG